MLANISGMTPIPDSQAETSISGAASANITVKDLVRLKLESTWNEYYISWHTEHCQRTLDSLGQPMISQPTPAFVDSAPRFYNPFDPSSEIFEITDFEDSQTAPKVFSTNAQHKTTVPKIVEAYSSYDSCTPLSRNLMRGDDPDYLPFIPFSDDWRYDFEYDNSHHKYFAWQRPEIDSDCRPFIFNFVFVDDLVIPIPQRKKSFSKPYGHCYRSMGFPIKKLIRLVFSAYQLVIFTSLLMHGNASTNMLVVLQLILPDRNFAKWKAENASALLPAPAKTNIAPRDTVQYFLDWFCNNLNCLTNPCPTHCEEYKSLL